MERSLYFTELSIRLQILLEEKARAVKNEGLIGSSADDRTPAWKQRMDAKVPGFSYKEASLSRFKPPKAA